MKNNGVFKFILIGVLIFIIGVLTGIFMFKFLDNDNLDNNDQNQKNPVNVDDVKLNEEKIKKWFEENYIVKGMLNNFDFKNANNTDYTNFLVNYIASMVESTESNSKGHVHKLLKSEAESIIKKYFDVDNVKINFSDIKSDDTSLFICTSDDNYYYVTVTAWDGYGDNTRFIGAYINDNNQIEVLYSIIGSYPNNNNLYDYYGIKKITLKQVDNSYKILKIETNLEENNN